MKGLKIMKKLTIIIASLVALTIATVAQARDQIKIVGSSTVFPDRKSTRLNSSHGYISYAVFCLKKKKTKKPTTTTPQTKTTKTKQQQI